MSPNPLIVLSDTASIDIDFSILDEAGNPTEAENAENNVKIEIQLPAGLSYYTTEAADGHTAEAFTSTTTGSKTSGIKITVGFTNSSLPVQTRVHLRVKVYVEDCAVISSETITVKVLSGATPIMGGEKTLNFNASKPIIRLIAPTSTFNLTTPGGGAGQKAPVVYNIDVTNGTARSLKIIFTGDQYTFLDNFRLDNVPVTAVESDSKTWTITLPNEVFNATARQLTFDTWSTRNSQRKITAAFQYGGTGCLSGTGTDVHLIYPTVSGSTKMVFDGVERRLVSDFSAQTIGLYDVPMDGVTPYYVFLTFKNDGNADAYDFDLLFSTARENNPAHGDYAYIDPSYIYYSIDGGTKTIPNRITPGARISNSIAHRKLKPGITNYCTKTITVNEGDVIPAGKSITVMFPVVEGNLYDNSTLENAGSLNQMHLISYKCSAKNGNGDSGTNIDKVVYQHFSMATPYFLGVTPLLARTGETGQITQRVYSGAVNASLEKNQSTKNQSITIHVQLPPWMELDGNVTEAFSVAGFTPESYTVDETNKTYAIEVIPTSTTNQTLTLKYKAGSNPPWTTNQNDTIRYWIDWNLGYTEATTNPNLRPSLENIAKHAQQANLLAEMSGIVLDALDYQRTTKGEKDSNSNKIPDVPGQVTAPDEEINHYYYRENDEGKIIVEGRIAQSTAGRDYFYAVLNAGTAAFQPNRMNLQAATLEVGAKEGTVFTPSATIGSHIAPVVLDNMRAYLKYTTGTAWNDGDYFRLSIPFKIGDFNPSAFVASSIRINAEAYLSDADITDGNEIHHPPAEYNRYGKDVVTGTFNVVIPYKTSQEGENSYTFGGIGSTSFAIHDFRDYYGTADVWTKEYRPTVKIKKLELCCPPGYVFLNGGRLKLRDIAVPQTYNEILNIDPVSSTLSADGTVCYRYDFSDLFEAFDDTDPPTDTDGKWMLSSGRFYYVFYVDVQPTREARYTAATASNAIYYDNLATGAVDVKNVGIEKQFYLSNTMPLLSLSTATTAIYAHSKRLTIPSISVAPTSSSTDMNVWLYVAGNVSAVSAKGSNSTITGSGFGGRWISLGALPSGSSYDYELSFDYGGASDCIGDTITVYSVSDFGESWVPDITAAIAIPDYRHNGPKKQIRILTGEARIDGSLSVPAGATWSFHENDTLTAVIDASSSPSILENPRMTLTIPQGQRYVEGSARLTCLGNSVSIASAVEEALVAGNGDLSAPRDFVFDLKTALGQDAMFDGYLSNPAVEQKAVLKLVFSPECETDLDGGSFSATFAGQTACGQPVDEQSIHSVHIPTGLNYNYAYTLSVATKSSNYALGGTLLNDTLLVTVTKTLGAEIAANDYTEIVLPQWLIIDGPIRVSSAEPDLSDLNGNVAPATTTRTATGIQIALPKGTLNAATNDGRGMPFTYEIPVRYTRADEPALVDNPKQTVRANVYTVTKMDNNCPNEAMPFSLGGSTKDVALLSITSSNRFTYNMTCWDCDITFNVTSADFSGGWYADELMSSPLVADNEYRHTPAATATGGVKTVYVKADIGNPAVPYGKVSIDIKALPTKLYWRATTTDDNWYDPNNWEITPAGGDNPNNYLPAPCSEVEFQPTVDRFPLLKDSAACHIVYFRDHTEIGRQNLLVYDSVRIDLTLEGNRWYMLSTPLQNFYSGDIHHHDPNPFYDGPTSAGLMIEPMLFNVANPETGKQNAEYKWTGSFNTADYEFRAGQGFAIWVDDWRAPEYDVHPETIFSFPKSNTQYFYYHPAPPHVAWYSTPELDRTNSHRLHTVDGDGDITLKTSQPAGATFILVGNPFMAHLDFEEFAKANSGIVNNEYKLAYGVSSDDGMMNTLFTCKKEDDGRWTTTDSNNDSETDLHLIPPMQSFIVKSATSGSTPTLKANIDHTVTSTKATNWLRSASVPEAFDEKLEILATRAGQVCKALLLLRDGATHDYAPEEDGYKLFSASSLKPVQVYMRSRDGHALDINTVGNLTEQIPLGIRTSEEGNITLQFAGMDSFREGTNIRLHDTRTGEIINLSQQPSYTFPFTKEGADTLYLENRFYLTLSGAIPTNDDPVQDASGISITHYRRDIHVLSHDGAALGRITICDVQGRILSDEAVTTSEYHHPMDMPGVYIVRVHDGRTTATRKVTIK
jgi:hypothetical protein